ncbi:MAG: helix-turn-helix transcriptional regulator [Raoultibacter sp.]
MNIQLMHLRKAAGFSNRDAFAAKIGVNKYTYRSWESGAAMMNAEQLWNCAEALGCTPNDILGWYETHSREPVLENAFERELVGCYRGSTMQRKGNILQVARDSAGMSKESSECVSHEPARREAM